MCYDYEKQANYDKQKAVQAGVNQTAWIGGAEAATKCAMPPSLRERLEKTYAHHQEQNARTGRALDILARHPEFSEFPGTAGTAAHHLVLRTTTQEAPPMGYNPETNTFVRLPDREADIPEHQRKWTRFQEGEALTLRGIPFRVHEVGESRLVLKPLKEGA